MSLSTLTKKIETHELAGEAVAVRIEKVTLDRIVAGLLIDTAHGPAGTMLEIAEFRQGSRVLDTIRGFTDGDRKTPGTGVGDVVIFNRGLVHDGKLVVDRIATRVHDGMHRPVQLLRMLMRPTKSWVSAGGAGQYATLADAAAAKLIMTDTDLVKFVTARLGTDYPGGRPGLILRGKLNTTQIMVDADDKWQEPLEDFAKRLIEDNKVLGPGPIEAIPVWDLPMGRQQVIRDVPDIRQESGPAVGGFGALYRNQRMKVSFKPTLAILADEDQWAFGGKTGRVHRVIAGAQPLLTTVDFQPETIPTAVRGAKVVPTTRLLYPSTEAIDAAMKARHARVPPPPPDTTQPKAATRPGSGRSAPRFEPHHDLEEPRSRGFSGSGGLGGLGR